MTSNAEYVSILNECHAGRTIVRVSLSGADCIKWEFDNGSYMIWHMSMCRGNLITHAPDTEGRLFKEDEHVTI